MFGDEFVGSREVEYEFGAGECELAAGGDGCPKVFAEFDAETYAIDFKELMTTEGYGLSTKCELSVGNSVGRGKPALLVEFFIVGQVLFRDDAVDVSALDNDGCVE